jgi:hypothetical protein
MGKYQKWYSLSLINTRQRYTSISLINSNPISTQPNLLKQSLKTSLDSRGVGTLNLVNTLALVVEVEGRHSRDAVLSSDGSKLVNVDLVEVNAGVGVAQLLEEGGDGLAGTAPCGEEVDDDGALGVCDLGLVLLGTRSGMLVSDCTYVFVLGLGTGLGSGWMRLGCDSLRRLIPRGGWQA